MDSRKLFLTLLRVQLGSKTSSTKESPVTFEAALLDHVFCHKTGWSSRCVYPVVCVYCSFSLYEYFTGHDYNLKPFLAQIQSQIASNK